MSQIVTRKGPVGEEKDKRQTDSPVKEMKKKIAANAEKEKQAAEKPTEKPAHSEKRPEKASEKIDKDKPAEKTDKKDKVDKTPDKKDKLDKSIDKKDSKLDKSIDKKDKLDKSVEKKDKTEKGSDKKEAEKKENAVEKESTSEKDGDDKKEDKSSKDKDGKVEADEKSKKPEPKAKENGAKVNGEQNGDTVSSEDELQDLDEKDEMFPELAYEDSDGEYFEPPTPEGVPSRSYTRRSQVKATRTPETPRPASDKHKEADKDYVPDDSKLLKLKEDVPSSDRKLRSSDSPKPHDRKERAGSNISDTANKVLIPVVVLEEANIQENEEKKAEEMEVEKNSAEETTEREIEVVVEVDNEDEGRVKADTNYSKSRVKVSPYRRSARLADHTNTSLLANYTGNNTTMEMDITAETSSFISEEPESPYLSGLRSIRGRRSYKPLREMALRNIGVYSSTRSNTSANTVTEHPTRPTGTVVGRKRKPSHEETLELATEAEEAARSKRARLLERLAKPFRMASTPLPARRAAEIVGINTDLPLSAPVASTETFDPEAIKPPTVTPVDPPTPTSRINERDSKRCVVM
ncbi:uncharacterized protein DDB_G0286299-like isoform X1 [Maniola hyperantus]|uniref:uncharacterized protein DDB_G0286299-like isoform X1 n=2 Tax=Aphantopus hyperantus TaxID=2795564 RepID=UPI001567E259|nr:splicing regulatory glutamine/lysine-rich protein 1-like [Maniola hyperantus]